MRTQYLHISAYSCERCRGQVISGSTAVRENEISKETEVREVGAICLSCGHRQSKATGLAAHATFHHSMGCRELYGLETCGKRVLRGDQSCRTTLSSELWTCSPPSNPP